MRFVGRAIMKLKLFFNVSRDVRHTPAVVRIGDEIRVQLKDSAGGFAFVQCVGNDPIGGVMLVNIDWYANDDDDDDVRKELRILSYGGYELYRFHLLNSELYGDPFDLDTEDSVLKTLDIIRSNCERNEEYEKAVNYRDAIRILKTNKTKN
jgi:hypothetical protein